MTDRPDLAEIIQRHQAAKRRLVEREETAMSTTPTTTTEFDNGDFVRVHPTPDDGIDVGQIVAVGINYPEPVYVVNLGNVYNQRYERYYAGSDLTLVDRGGRIADDEDGVNTLHRSTVTEPPF